MRYYLALIVLILAGIMMNSTISGIELEQQVPTATFTPVFQLLPTQTRSAPGCSGSLPIDIGGSITVRPGVNIRNAASISAPWLANFEENKIFTVLDGPVCADDFVWWRITGHGVNGWVAERNRDTIFIRSFDEDPNKPLPCRVPLVIALGEEIELTLNVRIREEPRLDGRVLTIAPHDSVVRIIDTKTVCANGYNWWQVEVTVLDVAYTGWMVEGRRSDDDSQPAFVDLTPAPDCSTPMPAVAGNRGRVRYNDRLPKNLRTEPSRGSEVLYTLVEGVPLEIIGGPVCSEGMNFWQVKVLANIEVTGWLAEGARPIYWINITDDIGAIAVATLISSATLRRAGTLTPTPTSTP